LAVGTTTQIAAALRLDGVSYDQVEKIEPVRGSNFRRVDDLPRYFIKDESVKLRGQDGSVVINLFDDAHAAIYSKTNNQGLVYRYRYNVKHGNSSDCYEFSQPSVSYDVVFKNEGMANLLTFTSFDPFILVNYAGTIWEVHKYKYKFNETLYSYYSGNPQAYNNGYTWALEIPYSWFRYPLIERSMGSYKNGALYGAYQTFDHSFGEWGANRKIARDWYLYPNTSMVY
jgi:LruC domain-containing protein